MNPTSDNQVENISDYLVHLFHENGILDPDIRRCNATDDLVESGLIDSMGLVCMQTIIHEKFGLKLELELFIAELRNIQSIAAYLAKQLPTGWSKQMMLAS